MLKVAKLQKFLGFDFPYGQTTRLHLTFLKGPSKQRFTLYRFQVLDTSYCLRYILNQWLRCYSIFNTIRCFIIAILELKCSFTNFHIWTSSLGGQWDFKRFVLFSAYSDKILMFATTLSSFNL